MTAFLSKYDALDSALTARGFPVTSPWWRAELGRFVNRRARRWVTRVGRRGGKSSTLCRLAVAWALWGSWSVPPGDVGVIAFLSVSRTEAAARLRTIREILTTLGVPFLERGEEIELTTKPCVFRVATCTTKGVVGFTSIAVFGDEVARWESADTAANPAAEVIGSLAPTLATQPNGFIVLSSSPWSINDYHAECFERGDTMHQIVSFAPTWIANPTITEERTHELEQDDRLWTREYAAIPGATESSAFDPADVDAAFANCGGCGRSADRNFMVIDASSLRHDAFTFAICGETTQGIVNVYDVGGFEGDELKRQSFAGIVEHLSNRIKAWGGWRVFGDQRESAALESMFQRHGINFQSFAWSEKSKDEAVAALRRMMREGLLGLGVSAPHAKLRSQLLALKAHLTPSGRTSYPTNGQDYASALVTLGHAVVAGEVQCAVQPGGGLAALPEGTDFTPLLRFAAAMGASGNGLNAWGDPYVRESPLGG